MDIRQKLMNVQQDLKAPKGQRNKFGNYNYRSCEDILEAVKPLLKEQGLTLVIRDEIKQYGERYYVRATAILFDIAGTDTIEGVAFARESLTKKGMDDSQITGTASSYARKYALNGLFGIDDTKDADTDEYAKKTKPSVAKPKEKQQAPSDERLTKQKAYLLKNGFTQADIDGMTPFDINAKAVEVYNKNK